MASKQTKTRLSPLERAELQARKLRADLEVMQLREAKKRLKGALNIHGAADRGRRNQDWMPGPSSADLAAIPDSTTLIPRARQLDRDSWIFRSAKKAFTRNVVGKGIVVTPHAKDRDGKPLTKLNKIAQMEFRRWATSAMACDVERRKTFAQLQRLATDEEFVAGEHLWMWVYQPPTGYDGRTDTNAPVGLRLQAFEPEQFDLRILSYEGREVRGGVEVDENGAAIAYHLYTRNPNDILYRHAFFSERVPRSRMFHYYKQDRVLQTRGVTRGAPVMNDIRDLERFRSATLWRCVMEACIGIIIKSPVPGGGGGPSNFFNPASGEQTQTSSGMSTADFVPGMVARPVQGEEIEPFIPQSPGNNYDPFTQLTVRGIGAGVGMSFGQIMRHSDGNYSAARQDMLEDRREWEPEQELIIDCLLRPVYELWFTFAASEGRFDGIEGFDHDEFLAERWRFVDADYIPPAQSWIDPEKEANAFAVLLANRLITREEIVAMRGGRFYQTIEKIAAEQTETDALNLSLPENAAETAAIRDFIKQVVATHTGGGDAITLNATDIGGLLARARFPTREGYTAPLLPVTVAAGSVEVTGEPVENAEGQVIAGGMQPPPAPPETAAAPKPPATGALASGDGDWVTINGTHVLIKDGVVEAGPSHMVGHTPDGTPSHEVHSDSKIEEDPIAGQWRKQAAKMTTPKLKRAINSFSSNPDHPISKLRLKVIREELEKRGIKVYDNRSGGKAGTSRVSALDGNEVAPRTIDIGGERAPGFTTTIDGVRPENIRVPLPVVPPEVPHYRTAENPAQCCATCSYIRAEQCTRFNFNPDPAAVCDEWRAVSITENIGVPNVAKTFPPGPQPGQPDLESRFYAPGDEGAPYPFAGTSDNRNNRNAVAALADDDGGWVTINGTHVLIQGGTITKGPSHMVGKKPSEVSSGPKQPSSSPSSGGIIRQPGRTKEEVFTHAAQHKPEYDRLLDMGKGVSQAIGAKVATNMQQAMAEFNHPGPVVITAPLKGAARSAEKVESKYGGDYGRLTDIVRGTIAVDKASSVASALDAVKAEAAKRGFSIVELDNRFEKPTAAGYRDISIKLKGPNGHISELQINTKAMMVAKEQGHKLYEQARSIEAKAAKEGRPLTGDEAATRDRLNAQMEHIYADAWRKSQ